MRRRGRSILLGAHAAYRPGRADGAAAYPSESVLVISDVPEEWRKHAQEPWRILFPDLDWTPPKRDE
jgi:hypothetical protein